ncbi:hypothetical protein HYC85_006149 [Camellia sinensis]|uniref:Uncharacterized protein n=1 Tax=Camellia sinensis TaxID=4442 RepID=A0A7J7HKC9_CAMSI|nr:hypothetical protein HYC85_006149 [Camellia sinensis]
MKIFTVLLTEGFTNCLILIGYSALTIYHDNIEQDCSQMQTELREREDIPT